MHFRVLFIVFFIFSVQVLAEEIAGKTSNEDKDEPTWDVSSDEHYTARASRW